VFDQPSGSSFYGPEVQYRTVLRGANSHLTAYVYDSANHGDYHHPKTIIETGELSANNAVYLRAPPNRRAVYRRFAAN